MLASNCSPRWGSATAAALAVALLPHLCPVAAAAPPAGTLGVSFDPDAWTLSRTVAPGDTFAWHVLLATPTDGAGELGFRLANDPRLVVTSRVQSPRWGYEVDQSPDPDVWIVDVSGEYGGCEYSSAQSRVVTYKGLLLAPAEDVLIAPVAISPGVLDLYFSPCAAWWERRPLPHVYPYAIVNASHADLPPPYNVDVIVEDASGRDGEDAIVTVWLARDVQFHGTDPPITALALDVDGNPDFSRVAGVWLHPGLTAPTNQIGIAGASARVRITDAPGLILPADGSRTPAVRLQFSLEVLGGWDDLTVSLPTLRNAAGWQLGHVADHTCRLRFAGAACTKGDVVSGDLFTAADALQTLRFAAQLDVPSTDERCRADVDSNGRVESGDAVVILRRAAWLAKGADGEPTLNPPASVSLRSGDGANSVLLVADMAFGVDIALQFDPSTVASVSATAAEGLMVVNPSLAGALRLAIARADTPRVAVTLRFDLLQPEALISVGAATAFGAAGQELSTVLTGSPFTLRGITAAPPPAPVPTFAVQVYPNPFVASARVLVVAPAGEPVHIGVFDLAGRRVRQLGRLVGTAVARSLVEWDGLDDSGRQVAGGVYLIRASTSSSETHTRAVRLR